MPRIAAECPPFVKMPYIHCIAHEPIRKRRIPRLSQAWPLRTNHDHGWQMHLFSVNFLSASSEAYETATFID